MIPTRRIPNAKRVEGNAHATQAVDFTLQEPCAHFAIPDVPAVATLTPTGYQQNLDLLARLEELTAA